MHLKLTNLFLPKFFILAPLQLLANSSFKIRLLLANSHLHYHAHPALSQDFTSCFLYDAPNWSLSPQRRAKLRLEQVISLFLKLTNTFPSHSK